MFEACEAAPQHRYLFLTKNPARYMELAANGAITKDQSNFWFGSTVTTPEMPFFWHNEVHTFVSIEPILAPFKDLTDDGIDPVSKVKWIIVGAETGNRKNKVVPRKSWIDEIVRTAKKTGTPVFMKDSLRDLMGDDFRQSFRGRCNMQKPENLRLLIEAIESQSKKKSLGEEYLKEHGYLTRENIGIGEHAYGIVMVPEDWVLPYLKELYARLTDIGR